MYTSGAFLHAFTVSVVKWQQVEVKSALQATVINGWKTNAGTEHRDSSNFYEREKKKIGKCIYIVYIHIYIK